MARMLPNINIFEAVSDKSSGTASFFARRHFYSLPYFNTEPSTETQTQDTESS